LTTRRIIGDFFLVTTPVALTTSGSVGMAIETRFCTRTWAMFRSTPRSKVMFRL